MEEAADGVAGPVHKKTATQSKVVGSHAYGSTETAFRSSYPSTEQNFAAMRSSQGLVSVDEHPGVTTAVGSTTQLPANPYEESSASGQK